MEKINRIRTITFLIVLSVSCTSKEDTISTFRPVYVEVNSMPARGRVNEPIEIHLTAIASNGCYSNLIVNMTLSSARTIVISGNGLAESSLACPTVLVESDTVLHFTPMMEGEYYFQFNKGPLPVRLDTLVVQG